MLLYLEEEIVRVEENGEMRINRHDRKRGGFQPQEVTCPRCKMDMGILFQDGTENGVGVRVMLQTRTVLYGTLVPAKGKNEVALLVSAYATDHREAMYCDGNMCCAVQRHLKLVELIPDAEVTQLSDRTAYSEIDGIFDSEGLREPRPEDFNLP